jgi:hypothetical protein
MGVLKICKNPRRIGEEFSKTSAIFEKQKSIEVSGLPD